MKKYILIKADTNDADYITKKTEISDAQIEKIKPIIEAIKNFKPYEAEYERYEYVGNRPNGELKTVTKKWKHHNNFAWGEFTRDDLGELSAEKYYTERADISKHIFNLFESFVPYGEHGVHTINSIEILTVQNEEKLL